MPSNLSTEYDATRKTLEDGGFATDTDSLALVAKLKQLVGQAGFEPSHSEALETLRQRVLAGSGMLAAVGAGKNEGKALIELAAARNGEAYDGSAAPVKRVAALKTLRHTYKVGQAGARSVWVIDMPKVYRDWPSAELSAVASQEKTLVDRINKSAEYFNRGKRDKMASGTQFALAWVQRALIVLANFGKDKGESAKLVKCWFETGDTSTSDLAKVVTDLSAGFKKIQAALNSNQLLFSDYPPDRGTADETDTEAFVFNDSWADRLNVVYIEKAFFARGGNVLSGRDNWARIIVHELSHSQVGTEDHPKDNSYGWQGINPKDPKFKGNGAVRNAENWAFFAADCAGALSRSERRSALALPSP